MRFDSIQFLLFAMAVIPLYLVLPWRRAVLVAASYLFYASWNPPFLMLLLASTWVDYNVGRRMEVTSDPARRKHLLYISLAVNLGLLGFFKYFNFFLDQWVAIGLLSSGGYEQLALTTTIPLGISFYTFQTLSYSIDVYRGKIKACRSLLDFSLFVAFFPQLLAGPILRATEFLPQIVPRKRATYEQVVQGTELVMLGVFKKVVLADTIGILVDDCFANPGLYSWGTLIVGTLAFSAQIYCDFSGYTTIARGLGKWFGYELPINFYYPILARNPIEWRKGWHISIGDWFRDYVYRPLGGDRKGEWRTALNSMITWALFGFWHGADWAYMIWGAYYGVVLVIYRWAKARGLLLAPGLASNVLGTIAMLTSLVVASPFMRAADVGVATTILTRIGTFADGEWLDGRWLAGFVVLYVVHHASRKWYREDLLQRSTPAVQVLLMIGLALSLMVFAGFGAPFFYFQF